MSRLRTTHSKLGKRIWHASNIAFALAADLDKDSAKPAELASDGGLESTVVLGLGETV